MRRRRGMRALIPRHHPDTAGAAQSSAGSEHVRSSLLAFGGSFVASAQPGAAQPRSATSIHL
jgi:hypothetical protein